MNTNLKLKSNIKKMLISNIYEIIPTPHTLQLDELIKKIKDYLTMNFNSIILDFFPEKDMEIINQYCDSFGYKFLGVKNTNSSKNLDASISFELRDNSFYVYNKFIFNELHIPHIQLPYNICSYQSKKKFQLPISLCSQCSPKNNMKTQIVFLIDFKNENKTIENPFLKEIYNLVSELDSIYKSHKIYISQIINQVSDLIQSSKNLSDIYKVFPELKPQITKVLSRSSFMCKPVTDETLKDVLEISEKYI